MLLFADLRIKINNALTSSIDRGLAYLICDTLSKRKNLKRFVPLKKDKLVKLTNNDKYSNVLRALVKAGIIERDYYEPGVKSYHYKLIGN